MIQQSFVFHFELINEFRVFQRLLFHFKMISSEFYCYRKDQTVFIIFILLTAEAFMPSDKNSLGDRESR